MNNKLLGCIVAGALGATLALATPAFAHGGGGGGHGGGGYGGGGMHGGGGGMHFGGGGGWHGGGGGWHGSGWHGGGMHSAHFARFHDRDDFHRFRDRDDRRFFRHRFHRFAFIGAYADYNGCLRRVWTSYGPQWVNVCGDYGY